MKRKIKYISCTYVMMSSEPNDELHLGKTRHSVSTTLASPGVVLPEISLEKELFHPLLAPVPALYTPSLRLFYPIRYQDHYKMLRLFYPIQYQDHYKMLLLQVPREVQPFPFGAWFASFVPIAAVAGGVNAFALGLAGGFDVLTVTFGASEAFAARFYSGSNSDARASISGAMAC